MKETKLYSWMVLIVAGLILIYSLAYSSILSLAIQFYRIIYFESSLSTYQLYVIELQSRIFIVTSVLLIAAFVVLISKEKFEFSNLHADFFINAIF